MKSTYSFILFLLFCSGIMQAQQTPGPEQTKPIIIMNATAHLGNGKVIENSAIAFENGKLTIVADARTIKLDMSKFEVVRAEGKHVYPGFIAPNTQIGIREIDAVRATRDDREVGRFNPSVRSLIAYNTDSRVTPTIRTNGILLAQVTPLGGTVSGQSSVMMLDGWNWEDAVLQEDDGVHMNWPAPFRRGGWWAAPGPITKNDRYDDQIEDIRKFMDEALAYTKADKPSVTNLKFEAMKGIFDGSKKLYIHVNYAKTIMEAVLFAEEYGITPVVVGAKDCGSIADFLKEHGVGVILHAVQGLPVREYDDIDLPFKTPSILEKAGVTYCFGMTGAWEQRNLAFQAGQAVSYGLDYEAAIKGLSLNAAKVMGIDKQCGSLETGKDATLFIAEGDVLDMRTSKLSHAFIQGRKIDLDNKQRALARKFSDKLGVDIED